jgi:hypothetical protein
MEVLMPSAKIQRRRARSVIQAAIREAAKQELTGPFLTDHVRATLKDTTIPPKLWQRELPGHLSRYSRAV